MLNHSYKFLGKYIIKADLHCLTGLHIGGTDEGFEIGGIDNPVIKDLITGYPYVPGSSLKGKLRSLLEWTTTRKDAVKENNETKDVERTRVENMLRQKMVNGVHRLAIVVNVTFASSLELLLIPKDKKRTDEAFREVIASLKK